MSGGANARLFIGLELPDAARAALSKVRAALINTAQGLLHDPSLYHLTLCFLGGTPRRAIPCLGAILDRIQFEPFQLTLSELSAFKSGAILWAGVQPPCVELRRLQRALRDELAESGFPVEEGAFTPHITLGRKMKPLQTWPIVERVSFEVRHTTLFESARQNGALTYLPLYRSDAR